MHIPTSFILYGLFAASLLLNFFLVKRLSAAAVATRKLIHVSSELLALRGGPTPDRNHKSKCAFCEAGALADDIGHFVKDDLVTHEVVSNE